MTEFQKVLVVDDGARNAEHAISAELAGLGFASVTTWLEATDEVLELIPPPAAILLQLPKPAAPRTIRISWTWPTGLKRRIRPSR